MARLAWLIHPSRIKLESQFSLARHHFVCMINKPTVWDYTHGTISFTLEITLISKINNPENQTVTPSK